MGLISSRDAALSAIDDNVTSSSLSVPVTPSRQLPTTKTTNNSLFIGDRRNERIKIVFCGNHFLDGYIATKQALINEKNVVVIQCHTDDILKEIVDAHVIVPLMAKIGKNLIQHAPRLAMIMQFGVGLEGVDIQAATDAGVYVSNIESTQCGNAQSCAEHAIYLALSVLRDQKAMIQSVLTGKLGQPTGRTLFHSNVLIYGYGGIGKQLVRRLSSFDVHITVIKKTPKNISYTTADNSSGSNDDSFELSDPYIDETGYESDFFQLAKNVDVVFLCCSQNISNTGMVDKAFLAAMKKDSIIVNVARGGLLNYSDVYDALESGHLGGIGFDVFHTEPFPKADPLLLHPKCIATPHVAGVTKLSYGNMANIVANNIIRMRAGIEPLGCANICTNTSKGN